MSSYSPSGGMNEIARSDSNFVSRTHFKVLALQWVYTFESLLGGMCSRRWQLMVSQLPC